MSLGSCCNHTGVLYCIRSLTCLVYITFTFTCSIPLICSHAQCRYLQWIASSV